MTISIEHLDPVILPVQGRWWVIIPIYGEDDKIEKLQREPIIGWLVERHKVNREWHAHAEPLNHEGTLNTERHYAIQFEDGHITIPYGGWFETEVELMERWNSQDDVRRSSQIVKATA